MLNGPGKNEISLEYINTFYISEHNITDGPLWLEVVNSFIQDHCSLYLG